MDGSITAARYVTVTTNIPMVFFLLGAALVRSTPTISSLVHPFKPSAMRRLYLGCSGVFIQFKGHNVHGAMYYVFKMFINKDVIF